MPIHAMIERQQDTETQRGSARVRMRLEVPGALGDGSGTTVLIHNISTSGLLMETDFTLTVGQSIGLTLPEAGEVAANVVWQSEALVGCRFEQPLSRAALSAARLRDPLPSNVDTAGELLHDRLLRLREEQGLSRAALAAQTGVSIPSLWAWETGKTIPRPANLRVLAAVFCLSEQELTRGAHPHSTLHLGSATDDAAAELQTLIDSSKQQIAVAAGVPTTSVKIIIEF